MGSLFVEGYGIGVLKDKVLRFGFSQGVRGYFSQGAQRARGR
jgi:hypothetical protein